MKSSHCKKILMATLRTYTFEGSVLIPLCILVSVFKQRNENQDNYIHTAQNILQHEQHGSKSQLRLAPFQICMEPVLFKRDLSAVAVLDLQQNSKWVWRD